MSQLNHEVDALQTTKGDCQMLVQKVKDLEGDMFRVDQASRRLTDKTKELENAVPEYSKMRTDLEDFHDTVEAAVMQVISRGESLQDLMSGTCRSEMQQHEEILASILDKIKEHVYDLYQKVGTMNDYQKVLQQECEKTKEQLEPINAWSRNVVSTIKTLEHSLSAEIVQLKANIITSHLMGSQSGKGCTTR